MKYQVIEDYHLDKFVEKVNEALVDGWHLQGGVSITAETADAWGSYAQAMTNVDTEAVAEK